jgi:Holliday junction resolvase
MAEGVTHLAYTVLGDIYGAGEPDIANLKAADLVERVQRIHRGLSAEHEFAAIASWLGRCSLVSQLDDVLHFSGDYRAPDFLVVTEYEGREVPFLVEVKSEHKDKMVWSAKYFESLCGFAKAMKLPLLVAWKRYGLWILADSDLFTKKVTSFHLTFDCALKNSRSLEMPGSNLRRNFVSSLQSGCTGTSILRRKCYRRATIGA